jgi:hypothetical protein
MVVYLSWVHYVVPGICYIRVHYRFMVVYGGLVHFEASGVY